MCPKDKKLDGFEQRERELLGDSYWDDPRWEKVRNLREQGKHSEANGLVFEIRNSWGVD